MRHPPLDLGAEARLNLPPTRIASVLLAVIFGESIGLNTRLRIGSEGWAINHCYGRERLWMKNNGELFLSLIREHESDSTLLVQN